MGQRWWARRMDGDGAVLLPTTVRRFLWRVCYEALAKRVSTPDWAFMNYGFAPATVAVDPPPLGLSDEPDRLCVHLYLQAIGRFDVRNRDVLEVVRDAVAVPPSSAATCSHAR